MTYPPVSVVIGFRDWGVERLRVAVASHLENARLVGADLEVVVSDYGSNEPEAITNALASTGAVVVRTERRGAWNRSAALNAGISVAKGEWIITTDADILFSPSLMRNFLVRIASVPGALYLAQCRDLPEGFDETRVAAWLTEKGWERGIRQAESVATIRPRWGMGGFAGFSRECFSRLNGYDERMQVWGGEDNDFAARVRRLGWPVRWLSGSHDAVYHVWHAPSQAAALESPGGRHAVETNREILKKDPSLMRNLPESKSVLRDSPLVSIIVPTFRRPLLLRESLESCIRQTFRDIEILVVENGDSNVAEAVVESLNDHRVKFLRSPRAGAAAARNFGLEFAKGKFIVIHDDDDLMVSTRVEAHLRAISEGVHGSYSGWIDFDESSFQPRAFYCGKQFSFESVLCNSKVLTHGALMLDRRVYNRHRYEEGLVAGIDYGFILLLARSGLALAHTGEFGILRRLHQSNMTAVNATEQKAAASNMVRIIREELSSKEYAKKRLIGRAAPELVCSNREPALRELKQTAVSSFTRIIEELRGGESPTDDLSLISQNWGLVEPHLARISQMLMSSSEFNPVPISDKARLYARLRLTAKRLDYTLARRPPPAPAAD